MFGIPGDSITAIAIGVLYIKGLNPGPTIFVNNPQNIYAIFLVFVLANLIMIPLGWLMIKVAKNVLRIHRNILMPIILPFCIVGSFAINNSLFGVGLILVFGVLAFILEENGFPTAPAILGVVLGTMLEENFITSMIKADGDFIALLHPADRGRARSVHHRHSAVARRRVAPAAPARRATGPCVRRRRADREHRALPRARAAACCRRTLPPGRRPARHAGSTAR